MLESCKAFRKATESIWDLGSEVYSEKIKVWEIYLFSNLKMAKNYHRKKYIYIYLDIFRSLWSSVCLILNQSASLTEELQSVVKIISSHYY